jgi:hypothetical protein
MGSRSLACALVRHRQAEPRGARRRPWTFDRVGPNCYVLRARTTGLLQGGVQCRVGECVASVSERAGVRGP